MTERPRYLTDEEVIHDSKGEGFGVSGELERAKIPEAPLAPKKKHSTMERADEALAKSHEVFNPIKEQALNVLYEGSIYSESAQMEDDGNMIFQEEKPKQKYSAAEYAEMAREAYFSDPNRPTTEELKASFWPLNS